MKWFWLQLLILAVLIPIILKQIFVGFYGEKDFRRRNVLKNLFKRKGE